MSPTLLRGDYICVSLEIPGRRSLSIDPLHDNKITVHRKKGIRSIEVNDIVVFNFPYFESKKHMKISKQFYCKRCVAVSGTTYNWQWENTVDSVYLPKKGDIIALDSTNYKHYHKCIEYETGQYIRLEKEGVYLAGSIISEYRFQHDYYFMRGDHTADSYDSRYWGLLPDDFILGVGQFIWFSKDIKTNKIRWTRIFSRL